MFDTIEPATKKYLKNVMQTVFVGLFWMFAHVVAGIFFQLGFIGEKVTIENIIFYGVMLITLFFLAKYFIKMWSTKK